MSDSQGRFRVRKGELEIEYEGPGFIQEYKAALATLGIVGSAQTRLEDAGFEARANQAVKPEVAPRLPIMLAPSLSGRQWPIAESGSEKSEFAPESPGQTTQASESSANQIEETRPQGTEQEREALSFYGNDSHKSEGAIPAGNLEDDKFKEVLKRLGLAK